MSRGDLLDVVGLTELGVDGPDERLHRDQIDDPAKRFFLTDGQLNRHDRAVQRRVNRFERALDARALAIEPVNTGIVRGGGTDEHVAIGIRW